jgi:hypothetical protein
MQLNELGRRRLRPIEATGASALDELPIHHAQEVSMFEPSREQLAARPLADLHAIASQLGIGGFRLLRKPELADAIVAAQPRPGANAGRAARNPRAQRRRAPRQRACGGAGGG